MNPERPLPEFWYPVALILPVLKALLLAAAPGGFGRISARVNRELIYAGTFVRRYLLAVARSLVLPPLRPRAPAAPTSTPRRRPLERPLPIARRLARGAAPTLCDLAIPWHVIRALPPALDILLTRLDRHARPHHWQGISDTG